MCAHIYVIIRFVFNGFIVCIVRNSQSMFKHGEYGNVWKLKGEIEKSHM